MQISLTFWSDTVLYTCDLLNAEGKAIVRGVRLPRSLQHAQTLKSAGWPRQLCGAKRTDRDHLNSNLQKCKQSAEAVLLALFRSQHIPAAAASKKFVGLPAEPFADLLSSNAQMIPRLRMAAAAMAMLLVLSPRASAFCVR
jgi:hypothetical protein